MRSLRVKLVLFMVLLILLMMATAGAFLMNSVAHFQQNAFAQQMVEAFSQREDFIGALWQAVRAPDAPERFKDVMRAYSGLLGLDTKQRNYYILDGQSGAYLTGSDAAGGQTLDTTPAILSALSGTPYYSQEIGGSFMDAAVPIATENSSYIIYIRDTKKSYHDLISALFSIILRALLFGVATAILLSLFLSKTITTPLERLTEGASRLASGNFSENLPVRTSDEIGELNRAFNNMADELKQTLEDVGAERDKLGTLFLHMTDGVAAFTADGTLTQINLAGARLLGLDTPSAAQPEDAASFSPLTLASSSDWDDIFGAMAAIEEVLALKPPAFLEREMTVNDRCLKVNLAPFGGDVSESVMAVVHDISEQRRLDQLRREFISNVSHELRTPLTNIHSYAETLVDAEQLPEKQARGFASVILKEAERMNRIVRDLLTLSSFDYGKMDWHLTSFPIAEVCRNVLAAFRLEAEKKNQTLLFDPPETAITLSADRDRIEQVLVNLLSNAIKYTPEGGQIVLSLSLEMEAENAPAFVRIALRDNGIGIPTEDIPRLFDRFYRVDKARARASGGSGLGLSIAKEIVDKHQGTIAVDSQWGEGTTMIIRLPVEKRL